ncbi:UNVERIFIED_CONTAM: hypothetical protein FKN15_041781 [Acipenser sinensis]
MQTDRNVYFVVVWFDFHKPFSENDKQNQTSPLTKVAGLKKAAHLHGEAVCTGGVYSTGVLTPAEEAVLGTIPSETITGLGGYDTSAISMQHHGTSKGTFLQEWELHNYTRTGSDPRRSRTPGNPRRSRNPGDPRRSRTLDDPKRSRTLDDPKRSRTLDDPKRSRTLDDPKRSRTLDDPAHIIIVLSLGLLASISESVHKFS